MNQTLVATAEGKPLFQKLDSLTPGQIAAIRKIPAHDQTHVPQIEATRPTSMSFGVSLGNGAYEYMGSDNLFTVFAQWRNLFSPHAANPQRIADVLRDRHVRVERIALKYHG